jgi:NADH:ubiquinone oxidoreductase subunit 3 (subunit A)
MSGWIFFPPVVFIMILGVTLCLSGLLGRLSFKPSHTANAGSRKAYACGEDIPEHKVQVNYGQFFPFAFFFTILHVLALMVATVPIETMNSFFIAVIYIVGGLTGLIVLFSR